MKRKCIKTKDWIWLFFCSVTRHLRQSPSLLVVCVFSLFLITSLPVFGSAASLDFGWGSPILVNKSDQKKYLVWPIQISNYTKRPWFAQLDVVAVTDTGKQYAAIPDLKLTSQGDLANLSLLKSNIFPEVTRRAVAVFKDVDPMATMVHFYVGGVIGISPTDREEIKYFKISYRRSLSGWKWDGSSVLE